ncbi:hypothetical protein F5Y01DRAFT_309122 [Xylaria sp. FL0043]|nr:hypothetical protein F5Y01DRAFT_309122 [Xylaria sp. FL0043]
MPNSTLKIVPETVHSWKQRVQLLDIQDSSLHHGNPRFSASKINEEQFLLLRVLWPELGYSEKVNILYQEKERRRWITDRFLEASRSFMVSPPMAVAWKEYIQSISKKPQSMRDDGYVGLQTFSLVRYHQIQASYVQFEDVESIAKVDFTPIAMRTRSRRAIDSQPPTTPTPIRNFNHLQIDTLLSGMDIGDTPSTFERSHSVDNSSSASATSTEHTDIFSPFTGTLADQFKALQDEQIVNTALIFLQADWTLHRRAFVVRDKDAQKTYEARVDGYLRRRKDDQPLVILEVKPYKRAGKEFDIRMQESAQMAAWISQHPPQQFQETPDTKKKSQQVSSYRHEIFLTFAEFDEPYVNYIRHRAEGTSYLTMNEYGPFDIGNSEAVEYLGELILAFALQACEEM